MLYQGYKFIGLFFLLFFANSSIFAQNTLKAFDDFLKLEAVNNAQVGFKLVDLSNNKVLYNYQENKNFVPASLQKIITTGVALDVLGANFHYETLVKIEGEVELNILVGNLKIIASGDPTINSSKLINDIILALQKKGIKAIDGKILIENSNFQNDLPQSWTYEDLANHYGAAAHGFNIDRNRYNLTFQQTTEGKPTKLLSTEPKMPYTFENKVVAGKQGSGDNAYILGAPFSFEREIVGTIPPGTGNFTIKGSMHSPSYFFIEMLNSKLNQNNISVNGIEYNNLGKTEVIYTLKSQKMAEIVSLTNKESINLYAEALLKTIAIKEGLEGTVSNGISSLEKCLQAKKIETNNVVFKDGSGLSRMNLYSPNFLIQVLQKYHSNETFVNSLAVCGESGTLKSISSTKLKGRVLAKSGSSTGILNYAGFINTASGNKYAFVIFVNNYTASFKDVRAAIVKLLEGIE